MRITIATSNQHKIIEITELLANKLNSNFQLRSLQKFSIAEPDEPYLTFLENACHKAQYYGERLQNITLSEDAGLCIPALNNFPGVKTKDFVEEQGSIQAAFDFLEKKLRAKKAYKAYFVCAAAIYVPGQNTCLFSEQQLEGRLHFPAFGEEGFGFDPIFIPIGYEKTLAELGLTVKNTIGHRSKAILAVINELQQLPYVNQNILS